jgi:hypothetical protein
LALANLGFSYCMGFGLPIDREKGLELIREASRRDHAVAIEWLARANYCPVFPKRDGVGRMMGPAVFRKGSKPHGGNPLFPRGFVHESPTAFRRLRQTTKTPGHYLET